MRPGAMLISYIRRLVLLTLEVLKYAHFVFSLILLAMSLYFLQYSYWCVKLLYHHRKRVYPWKSGINFIYENMFYPSKIIASIIFWNSKTRHKWIFEYIEVDNLIFLPLNSQNSKTNDRNISEPRIFFHFTVIFAFTNIWFNWIYRLSGLFRHDYQISKFKI